MEKPAILLEHALRDIPKILTQQDRNQHSETYGCFDRNYWHYRITDFPSGMSQEFVLPLALVWSLRSPDNPWFADDALREWIIAGIDYMVRSAHFDGSCDDYFPYERASGAAAFSLYAALVACDILEVEDPEFDAFFLKRGQWLFQHHETGRLSNHEALIANCLLRLGRRLEDEALIDMAQERLERLLGWQDDEGWFCEYEGCDPGYMTLTISLLAEMEAMFDRTDLREPLNQAIAFLGCIQPPDGWFGGEWSSRNTHNFFPYGLELCGAWNPQALWMNDRAISALEQGPCYADDHLVAHHCWNYLMAYKAWCGERPAIEEAPAKGREYFQKAGLLIDRYENRVLLCATKKGGAYRVYEDDRLVAADTGMSLVLKRNKKQRIAVTHLWNEDIDILLSADSIRIKGGMSWAKSMRMTPLKNIVLRSVMITGGRFFPNLIRKILQRLLITGSKKAPFSFERKFEWHEGHLDVSDKVETESDWKNVTKAGIGPLQTSTYVVMSRVYHPSQHQPWINLSDQIPKDASQPLLHRRHY